MIETLGGGVAWIDFDGDQFLDLAFSGGGSLGPDAAPAGLPSALFRNLGERRFAAVSKQACLDAVRQYSHAVQVADYDADGFPDLLITGFRKLVLWHNQGDGTFEERQEEAQLAHGESAQGESATSAAWGDFNGDGCLDLFVGHYVDWSPENHLKCLLPNSEQREYCSPRQFHGRPGVLYLGAGDGRFVDGTSEAGVGAPGKMLGVVAGDVDLDGDLDFYVGNDTVDNFLFVNDGRGKFQEIGLVAGVATNDQGLADGSMGVDLHDYNNDGRPDLWAANYEREAFALYRNQGDNQFLHVSQSAGITALGGLFVGWGTSFSDLDRDGDEDIVVACGHVLKYPTGAPLRQKQLLLENVQGRFRRVVASPDDYFGQDRNGRGVAVGDFDNDGDLDVALSPLNEPAALLVNDTAPGGDWLGLRLVGRRSNRDAIGASLTLQTSAGRQLRFVKGGGSYLSQSDSRVFWGIPRGANVESVEIRWPSGARQSLVPLPNSWQTVLEPDDAAHN